MELIVPIRAAPSIRCAVILVGLSRLEIEEIVNVIQFDKTKPKGSNPNKIIRNKRICKEYDKFTNKGRKQIEAERLLSKKYDLSPQTIRKIVKDPNNTL